MGDTSRQEYLGFVSEFGTVIDEAKTIFGENAWRGHLAKSLTQDTPTEYLKTLQPASGHQTGAREMTA